MKWTRLAGVRVGLLLGVVVAAALASCGSGWDQGLSGVGESCTKAGDCEQGYKCLNRVCQLADADCPADEECSGRECGPDPVCGESCGSSRPTKRFPTIFARRSNRPERHPWAPR